MLCYRTRHSPASGTTLLCFEALVTTCAFTCETAASLLLHSTGCEYPSGDPLTHIVDIRHKGKRTKGRPTHAVHKAMMR